MEIKVCPYSFGYGLAVAGLMILTFGLTYCGMKPEEKPIGPLRPLYLDFQGKECKEPTEPVYFVFKSGAVIDGCSMPPPKPKRKKRK